MKRMGVLLEPLAPSVSAVWNLLCWFKRKYGHIFPSLRTLSEMLGVSKRTIKRATAELVRLGLLLKERRYRRSSEYILVGVVNEAALENRTVGSDSRDCNGEVGTPALHVAAVDAREVRAPGNHRARAAGS